MPVALVAFLSIVSASPSPRRSNNNHSGGGGNSGNAGNYGNGGNSGDYGNGGNYGNVEPAVNSGGTNSGSDTMGGSNTGGTSDTQGSSTTGSSSRGSGSGILGTTSNVSNTSSSNAGVSISTKKGTGTWLAAKLDVSWAYDWTDKPADSFSVSSSIDLVPLINTTSDLKALAATSSYKEVLGYNEPEIPGLDGNGVVSVSTAVSQWPDIVATGKRTGSPAPGVAKVYDGDWLDQFMDGITKAGSHVDFVALHYYTTDGDVSKFQAYLDATHSKYNLPIWVTEWGYVDYSTTPPTQPSDATMITYMQSAAKMLDGLSYVERFLWCDVPNSGRGLFENGELSDMGLAYKAL